MVHHVIVGKTTSLTFDRELLSIYVYGGAAALAFGLGAGQMAGMAMKLEYCLSIVLVIETACHIITQHPLLTYLLLHNQIPMVHHVIVGKTMSLTFDRESLSIYEYGGAAALAFGLEGQMAMYPCSVFKLAIFFHRLNGAKLDKQSFGMSWDYKVQTAPRKLVE